MALGKAILFASILCIKSGIAASFLSGGVTSLAATKQTNHHYIAINTPSVRLTLPTNLPVSKKKQAQVLAALSFDSREENAPVQKRRAFLANFASSSLMPFLATTFGPPTAVARGVTNEKGPLVYGDDSIMAPKEHGTTSQEVQENLRYGVSRKLADKISSFNRVFAEMGGYFTSTSFESDVRRIVKETGGPVTFYDSVSGKPLFRAPIGRSVDEFIAESEVHGWPSFRDDEVVWDNVRVLRSSGETVSTIGTHLGHNLPDQKGNRYCINLVSIAGNPVAP
ncbi:hypothetical protein HJC23_007602 [Cyclotella cryptica]|uniref:Peptide-methionine (R)-S-oxide reductase n=1 Tax=Cyclotella cryptica TaxID=29204 RepID=A0ABD3QR19_9STRA|eukprot:CCRYP_002892-RA/>CCRYP_002892-RA protein AED:0.02 eAED:0.02 QI:95/1/1/1/1/1/2/433/280